MEAASELSACLLDHRGEAETLKELSVPVPSLTSPLSSGVKRQNITHHSNRPDPSRNYPSRPDPSRPDLSRPDPSRLGPLKAWTPPGVIPPGLPGGCVLVVFRLNDQCNLLQIRCSGTTGCMRAL